MPAHLERNFNLTKISIQSLGISVYSLKEYMDSNLSKLEKITSGKTASFNTIALPLKTEKIVYTNTRATETIKDCVVMMDVSDIQDVIENGGFLNARYNSEGDSVVIESDELLDMIEDSVKDFQIQSEFLTTCLSNDAITPQSFISAVSQKYPNIDINVVSQYADLFRGGEKLQALKGWIAQSKVNRVSQDSSGKISMVNREDYTGVNVWAVVIDDFKEQIYASLESVWSGIRSIQEFFKKLWDAALVIGKYILSKAFRYLTSNLSSGESKFGLLDFPIVQMPICFISESASSYGPFSVEILNDVRTLLTRILQDASINDIKFKNSRLGTFRSSDNRWSNNYFQDLESILNQVVNRCCVRSIEDPDSGNPTGYTFKNCDVTALSGASSFIDGFTIRLAIGPGDYSLYEDSRDVLYIAIYANIPEASLDTYDDISIYDEIRTNAFPNFIYMLNFAYELLIHTEQETSSDIYGLLFTQTQLTSWMIPQIQPAPGESLENTPIDFAESFKFITLRDFTHSASIPSIDQLKVGSVIAWFLINGPLMYACFFGPCSDYRDFYMYDPNSHKTYLKNEWARITGKAYNGDLWTTVDADIAVIPNDWNEAYKPYVSYTQTPVAVHVQTITERAKEIEWTIIAAIIAIAVTALAASIIKFKTNLAIKSEIAAAQRDKFAWELDPTDPSQIQHYKNLRKKARRLERLNSLFGKSSILTTIRSGLSASDNAGDSAIAASNCALQKIETLIKG